MKNFWMTALFMGGLLSSCNSQNAVVINGEKMELEDGIYAHINTSQGDILIDLAQDLAPMTTANFVALAEGNHPLVSDEFKGKPFYDGLIFHRVIPSFMIQGGDPQGSGMGGPGYKFENETSTELSHKLGAVSMANSGPNTNGSQFFITVAETAHLDGGYNVFGYVLSGQDVANAISSTPRNSGDRPDTDVVMNTVTIIRSGSAFKDYDAVAEFNGAKSGLGDKKKAKEQELLNKVKEYAEGADSTSTGMYYKVIEEGTGVKPNEGQKVLMNYSGYLLDGTLFDSSIEADAKAGGKYNPKRTYAPLEVEASRNAGVILGWREALTMMNVGDKWRLIIPPHLGYGARGAGNVIPPNAWLIFDVEMVSLVENPAK
jgi:peptidyl-prolyl cis-trans isomerase A (cyclophilin A)